MAVSDYRRGQAWQDRGPKVAIDVTKSTLVAYHEAGRFCR